MKPDSEFLAAREFLVLFPKIIAGSEKTSI